MVILARGGPDGFVVDDYAGQSSSTVRSGELVDQVRGLAACLAIDREDDLGEGVVHVLPVDPSVALCGWFTHADPLWGMTGVDGGTGN